MRRKNTGDDALCTIMAEPDAYAKAMPVIHTLKEHRYAMTSQEYRTLKGVALSGDTEGALKGLKKILYR